MINHHLYKKEGVNVAFSSKILEKVRLIIKRYPDGKQKSALLPILHIAQEESGGYLNVEIMDYVASLLEIQPIEVYEVATFYTMFNLEKTGTYLIEVCRTGPCAISGGEHILDYLEKKLNIKTGETTSDGLFTLKTTECLGACGNAPVMQVNTEYYEFLSNEKIDLILDTLKKMANGNKPEGSRWVEKF
ncbi:MAG: NAD(P)H-dependent oxidoreductase subunit E [Bacteroidetes bacterium]|nr:NAD(P)H-dependent oxidoreductase subunit E [Bacteroidota bacterium]